MKPLRLKLGMVVGGIMALGVLAGILQIKGESFKHDFTGQCSMCHEQIPEKGTPFGKVTLKDSPERLCANCHKVDEKTSHPVGVKPRKAMAMQAFLDDQGCLSCLTCHDVHKEQKGLFGPRELKGLLRGHAIGRAFCYTCHNDDMLGAQWRHTNAINYAHMTNQLVQEQQGGFLDAFSVECLSCHDGVISRMTDADQEVRAGDFRHSIGLSHPIGVEYPRMSRRGDYVDANALPKQIKLFDGKVGCLSCHNPYGDKKNFLVMDNKHSALCLSCHRK